MLREYGNVALDGGFTICEWTRGELGHYVCQPNASWICGEDAASEWHKKGEAL